jgi:Na+/pantothenate symporter
VSVALENNVYKCAGQLQQLVLGLEPWVGIVIASGALLCYLIIGGFYAGTFTDSLQYIFTLMGIVSDY